MIIPLKKKTKKKPVMVFAGPVLVKRVLVPAKHNKRIPANSRTRDIPLDSFRDAFISVHKNLNTTRLSLCDVFIVVDRNPVRGSVRG